MDLDASVIGQMLDSVPLGTMVANGRGHCRRKAS